MGLFQGHSTLVGWAWRAGGELHMAALDCCGLVLVPHLLLGPRVLFWRQVEGESSAPEQKVDVGILCDSCQLFPQLWGD